MERKLTVQPEEMSQNILAKNDRVKDINTESNYRIKKYCEKMKTDSTKNKRRKLRNQMQLKQKMSGANWGNRDKNIIGKLNGWSIWRMNFKESKKNRKVKYVLNSRENCHNRIYVLRFKGFISHELKIFLIKKDSKLKPP